MNRIAGLAGAAVLAMLAACSGKESATRSSAAGDSTRTLRPVADAGWLTYNGGYSSQRYSALDQITTANVSGLKPVCSVKLGEEGSFQSGPIVIGDTLIVTTPHSTVALNAANCALIWRTVDNPRAKDVFPVNRGAAYLAGRVFRGTPDGRLVAMDSRTGKVVWTKPVGNPLVGEFISSAPIAWNGMVFVGLAGSDWGVRGRMMAFDATSGEEKWHFYTVPMGSEPGAESWKIPSTAAHGGGAQWTSYTLDTATKEVFVPVANPAPDFAPHARPGDNLYTNSVVVLDAGTGKLAWYHQLTPNDGFDWDLGAAPMIYDGADGRRVALGSKDGFLYSLDRAAHNEKFKTAVTTISNADTVPTTAGVDVCPGPLGGVEWNGPAYDPKSKTIYVPTVDWCAKYVTTAEKPTFQPGGLHMGTSYSPTSDNATGWLTAVDAQTGQVKWKYHTPQPDVAGVTPTAGGLVLNGDLAGNLYAFDAATGKVLLSYKLPGAVAGGVITYAVGGKQYVAATSGNISRTTFKTVGSPTLVILSLGVQGSARDTTLSPVQVSADSAKVQPSTKPGSKQ